MNQTLANALAFLAASVGVFALVAAAWLAAGLLGLN